MSAGTAYSKRYAGGFVDLPTKTTPVDQQFLNAVETALLQLLGSAPTADGQVAQWDFANTRFGPALILNKNVDPAAAIAKSKLDFTGANGIVDADIAVGAAIQASKISGLSNPTGSSLAVNIGSANTDLAAPSTPLNYSVVTTAGGSLRSIGAPPLSGSRITMVNSTINFVTLLHQTAGGTGVQLNIINAGNRYLAPGQSIKFVYDGTYWSEVERPPVETICDLLLSGSQATFDTNTILGGNIPQVYTELEVVVLIRDTGVNATYGAQMRLNNDSGANYDWIYSQGNGPAQQNGESLGNTFMELHQNYPGAGATAAYAGISTMRFPSYAQATFDKIATTLNAARDSTASGHGTVAITQSLWRNNAAITRLQAISGVSFATGSRFTLRGITS